MSSSGVEDVALPPEVAAELAGYMRSSLFAPLVRSPFLDQKERQLMVPTAI
jgi:hypothetical protein